MVEHSPHALPGLVLYDDHLELPPRSREVMSVCDLLAEPTLGSAEWGAACVRRVIAASTGPVAVAVPPGPIRERLEHAGWFVAARDAALGDAREACWRLLPELRRLGIGYGSCRPRLVIVGERTNRAAQLPFASRSGVWLFLALRRLGYDELEVYLANCMTLRGKRRTADLKRLRELLPDARWVAMGRTSSSVLAAARIQHAPLCHPSYHRRFKYAEDVAGYAARFVAAGVEPGRWTEGTLPVHPVESIPDLPRPYDVRDLQAPGRPPPDRVSGPEADACDPAKVQVARRAYVTGEAQTIQGAAKLANLDPSRAQAIAKGENWRAEREDFQRAATDRVKREVEDRIVKAASESVDLLWQSVKLQAADTTERSMAARGIRAALEKLAERRAAGDEGAVPLHASPAQLEALIRSALTLSGSGAGDLDPDRDRVRGLPLAELAKETLRVLRDQFGEVDG